MGLKEIIAIKKINKQLENLYCGITDSFMDITDRVDKNKLAKSAAVEMLEVVGSSGKDDYAKIKASNTQYEEVFIKADKEFTPLFRDIDKRIEKYNNDLGFTI